MSRELDDDNDDHLAPDSPSWRAAAERGSRRLQKEIRNLFEDAARQRAGRR